MLSRRAFFLAGHRRAARRLQQHTFKRPTERGGDASWYVGTQPDHPFPIPLVDRRYLPVEYLPQAVSYEGGERPGTVVVNIDERFPLSRRGGWHRDKVRHWGRTSGLRL